MNTRVGCTRLFASTAPPGPLSGRDAVQVPVGFPQYLRPGLVQRMTSWIGSSPRQSPTRALHERERSGVPRPLKKAEFEIQFGTSQAERGWMDLKATTLNGVVDAWDFLTRTPLEELEKNHQLKGPLATVTHRGGTFDRWQFEFPGGARIWFYVEGTLSAWSIFTPVTPTRRNSS